MLTSNEHPYLVLCLCVTAKEKAPHTSILLKSLPPPDSPPFAAQIPREAQEGLPVQQQRRTVVSIMLLKIWHTGLPEVHLPKSPPILQSVMFQQKVIRHLTPQKLH